MYRYVYIFNSQNTYSIKCLKWQAGKTILNACGIQEKNGTNNKFQDERGKTGKSLILN